MQHVQSAAYNQWQHDTPYGDYRAEQAIRDVMQLVDRYVVDKRVEGLGINGNVYPLRQWTANYKGKPHHWISLPGGMQKCPYSSIDKFNENWLSVNVEPPINPKPLLPTTDQLMNYGDYDRIRN